uniref:Uncharacterized protein n=1 Tax=viral metagenome TaxID=1070528 RepID=A0A6C0C6R0_9ZZZZ
MNKLHVITIVFILYAVSFFIAPRYIRFPQIAIDDQFGLLIPWAGNNSDEPIVFNKNTFMKETCHIWNTYPNITRIQFYLGAPVGTYERDIQTKNIYSFLVVETIIFIILSILIFGTGSSTPLLVNFLVNLSLLMWIISVGFDILGTADYYALNGFVYQNTYDAYGKVFPSKWLTNASDKEMGVYFYDQFTLVKQVCDMRNYFYYNGDNWFMTFKNCTAKDNFLDSNKICSVILKLTSLGLLVFTNIVYRCTSYEQIEDQ